MVIPISSEFEKVVNQDKEDYLPPENSFNKIPFSVTSITFLALIVGTGAEQPKRKLLLLYKILLNNFAHIIRLSKSHMIQFL